MARNVSFKNEKTNEIKKVKVGWSWTLFFFSGFLGLPLFWRKLHAWGAVFLTLWAISFMMPVLIAARNPITRDLDDEIVMNGIILVLTVGLSIWMAIKGNEMTAKNYLENDWVWQDEDGEDAKFAKGKWGMS